MTPELTIDILGVLVGLIAIYYVYTARVGGRVGKAVSLFVWGIIFQVSAISYTIVFGRLALFAKPGGVDIHHLLMVVGLVLFVWGARVYASLLRDTETPKKPTQ